MMTCKARKNRILGSLVVMLCLLELPVASAAVVSRKVTLTPVPGEEGKWTLAKPGPKGRAPASAESGATQGGGLSVASDAANPTPAVPGETLDSLMPPGSPVGTPWGGMGGVSPTSPALERTVKVDMNHLPVFKELITPEMVESAYPRPLQKDRRWHLAVGGDLGGNLSDRQVGTVAIGCEWSFTDLFVRGRMGNALWGGMEVRPGTLEAVDGTGFPSYEDADSEYNRIRLGSDPWSVMDLQFGLGWRGNLLPVVFPNFSQAFHMTVTTGQYVDVGNALTFTPMLWGFEASTQWHMSASGAWAIEGRVGYSFGTLQLSGAESNQLGRLPVRFLDGGASLVLWF